MIENLARLEDLDREELADDLEAFAQALRDGEAALVEYETGEELPTSQYSVREVRMRFAHDQEHADLLRPVYQGDRDE